MFGGQNVRQTPQRMGHGPEIPPLKSVKRSSAIAWCPSSTPEHQGLLASGTISGTIDASWSSTYYLEIFSTNFSEPSDEMRRIGAIEFPQSFSSIAWGEVGPAYQAGVIAGGLSDGIIQLCDPIAVAGSKSSEAILGQCKGHGSPVASLAFHPSKPNLLASASQDGEVLIWDLQKISQPTVSKPHKASKAHAMGVTHIAWNNAVPFILASTSEQGVTNIWDLRYKRAIVTMKTPGQYRLSTTGLCWHPTESVQIALGYKGPIVEIWDLRKKGFPDIKITNETTQYMHSGSVETMAWCPHEPRTLMTSGDDCRTIFWDVTNGSYLTEVSLGGPLNDVRWHPTRPSVLSTSSFEGDINVHAIHDFGPQLVPQWLKRPTGVSFGFGGKMVNFGADIATPNGSTADVKRSASGTAQITVRRTVTEQEFVRKAKALVRATREMSPNEYCMAKKKASTNEQEKEVWSLMNVLFEAQGPQRQDMLLKELGFQSKKREGKEGKDAGQEETKNLAAPGVNGITSQESLPAKTPLMSEGDFWASMQDDEGKKEDAPGDDNTKTEAKDKDESEDVKEESKPPTSTPTRPDDPTDDRIRAAVLVADYEKAANICALNGRMADALLIAQCGGPDLWRTIVNKHYGCHPSAWARRSLLPLVIKDYNKLVEDADISEWRETLAMLLAYAYEREDFGSIVDKLAARLEVSDDAHAATICYMISGNIDRAVGRWLKEGAENAAIDNQANGVAASALQAAIEKLHYFSLARGLRGPSSMTIARKYCEFAGMLAAQGEAMDALTYLKATIPKPDPSDSETIALFERLEQSIDPMEMMQQQQIQEPVQPHQQMQQQQLQPNQRIPPNSRPGVRSLPPGPVQSTKPQQPNQFQPRPPQPGRRFASPPAPGNQERRTAPFGPPGQLMRAPAPMRGMPAQRAAMPRANRAAMAPAPRAAMPPAPRAAMPAPNRAAIPGPNRAAMPPMPPNQGIGGVQRMPPPHGLRPQAGAAPGAVNQFVPNRGGRILPSQPPPKNNMMPPPRRDAAPPSGMLRNSNFPSSNAQTGSPPGPMVPAPGGRQQPPMVNNAPMGGLPQRQPIPAPSMPNPNPPSAMRGAPMNYAPTGGLRAGGSNPPPARGKQTGPRYSDLPDLPSRGVGTGPANSQELSTAATAVQVTFGGIMSSLRANQSLSPREQKRIADVEKRLEELHQRLNSGNGISSRTATTLKKLCDVLSSPQGMDVNAAKKLHLQLVTEDTGRENLKWLTAVKQLLNFCK